MDSLAGWSADGLAEEGGAGFGEEACGAEEWHFWLMVVDLCCVYRSNEWRYGDEVRSEMVEEYSKLGGCF